MLRTLAINSNKKCVKFWCFDSFLITKANLKLRRVIWNPCKEYTRTVRLNTPSKGIQTTYPGRICTRLPPICTPTATNLYPVAAILHPDVRRQFVSGCRHLHPDARRHFAPGCRALSTRMFTSGILTSDGRSAILHSAAVFSWSFLIFATDILGYFEIFCFRYYMSKSPKSPCNPPIIGFLSY